MPTAVDILVAYRAAVKEFPIIVVTGGSGYIGSHTVLRILKSGCAVVVVDNLVNSHMEALIRVYHIAKAEFSARGLDPTTVPPLFFHSVDLCERKRISNVFQFWATSEHPAALVEKLDVVDVRALSAIEDYRMRDYVRDDTWEPMSLNTGATRRGLALRGKVVAVVHFAALKAVGESISKPLQYFHNNITGLIYLLQAMTAFNVNKIVFSSSAVVYGAGQGASIPEDAVQVGGQGRGGGFVTNPYGRSKWMAEEILNDCCTSNPNFQVVSLRYFNPTGSHPSGLIGEDPKGTPNNIVPVILQAYQRRRSKVYVFGSDYDTRDGTGVRDFIHVEDLGRGHLAALQSLLDTANTSAKKRISFIPEGEEPAALDNYRVYNLGSGTGYSVLDIISAFASVAKTDIPYQISGSRSGDLGIVTASTTKAMTELGWQANFNIQDMCRDVHAFATENPAGYERLRRLSTLALHDPQAFHKMNDEVGLDETSVEELITGVARLAAKEDTFNNAIRRLSVLSDTIKDDMRKGSISDIGPSALEIESSVPQWCGFADNWQATY
jgi:UDP-glucose 4-epimerase